MTDLEMRDALGQLLAGEPPAPDPGAVVLRAERAGRQRMRRRLAAVAALAVVVAGAGAVGGSAPRAAVSALPGWLTDGTRGVSDQETYARWSTGPARGPRAGDVRLREQALAAWRERSGLDRLPGFERVVDVPVGEPRVAWAGEVLGEPVVVIHQGADITPQQVEGLDEGAPPRSDVWAAVRVPGDRPGWVESIQVVQSRSVPDNGVLGFWTDRAAGRVLLLDLGVPLVHHLGVRPLPGRDYTRDLLPVPFADGVAILDVGTDVALGAVKVGPKGPGRVERHALSSSEPLVPSDGSTPTTRIAGLQTPTLTPELLANTLPLRSGDAEQLGSYYPGDWFVAGDLADGTAVALGPWVIGDDPRLLLLVRAGTRPSVEDVGRLSRSGRPVAVALPGGRGWLVVAWGAEVRYRTGASAPWRAAGRDAAWLPANADLTIEAVYADGTRRPVALSR